jgi:hypothetical protein
VQLHIRGRDMLEVDEVAIKVNQVLVPLGVV